MGPHRGTTALGPPSGGQAGSGLGPRRAGKLRLHMEGLPHLKDNRINLKKSRQILEALAQNVQD